MDNDPISDRPEPEFQDRAIQATKIALTAIPFGGTAAELFEALFRPPLSRRRDEWLDSIADGLRQLQDQVEGFKIEDLPDNDAFVTVITNVTQVALRNHQREKLDALRNAVLNSALDRAPDDDILSVFLNLVDRFTPWHLRILEFAADPRGYGEKREITYPDWNMGGVDTVLEHTFPELKDQREFTHQLWKDLFAAGLTNTESLGGTMTAEGMFASRITGWGKRFRGFIQSPLADG